MARCLVQLRSRLPSDGAVTSASPKPLPRPSSPPRGVSPAISRVPSDFTTPTLPNLRRPSDFGSPGVAVASAVGSRNLAMSLSAQDDAMEMLLQVTAPFFVQTFGTHFTPSLFLRRRSSQAPQSTLTPGWMQCGSSCRCRRTSCVCIQSHVCCTGFAAVLCKVCRSVQRMAPARVLAVQVRL